MTRKNLENVCPLTGACPVKWTGRYEKYCNGDYKLCVPFNVIKENKTKNDYNGGSKK
jgi:hypothetical protein